MSCEHFCQIPSRKKKENPLEKSDLRSEGGKRNKENRVLEHTSICIPTPGNSYLHSFAFINTRQTDANCGGIICVSCCFSQIISFSNSKQNIFHLTLPLVKQYDLDQCF